MALAGDTVRLARGEGRQALAATGERGWRFASALAAGLCVLPLAVLVGVALLPGVADRGASPWLHLVTTVLPNAAITTVLLMGGVGLVAGVIGVATAWLVAACRFPGRGVVEWALLLPLAIPTYIVAYAHVEVMDYTGPLQSALRSVFGYTSARQYWFPTSRSLPNAIFVMGLVLYPYVYMTTRAMFELQSSTILEAARTLGARPLGVFGRVALPLARPAIAVGVTLAMMECLNDIGAVEYFGVKTLTFSVYDTWLNRSSLSGAAQIAVVMLVIVLALVWLERHARRNQRFHVGSARNRHLSGYRLTGLRAWLALAVCALPVLLGFVVPVAVLLDYTSRRLDMLVDPGLVRAAANSLLLAATAAVVTIAAGLVLAYAVRLKPTPFVRGAVRAGSIGYAVPGAVLAVGILLPLTFIDNRINEFALWATGTGTGLLLMSSGAALVYAYLVRFLAVSVGSIEAGLQRISVHLDMAARTLGRSAERTLLEIHLPMLRPVLVSAGLLVFVDAMKELPATLLLRPFNVETLATWVYVQASREAIGDAAPAALAIVLVGLLPLVSLARLGRSKVHRGNARRGLEDARMNV